MWIMVAGPYRSGAASEADRQRNLRVLNVAALEVLRRGHVPVFRLDWEHRFEPDAPVYLQVSRAGCVRHLTEHHGDCTPGSTVFVRVTGLDRFHAEISARATATCGRGSRWRPGTRRSWKSSIPSGIDCASTSTSSRRPVDRP